MKSKTIKGAWEHIIPTSLGGTSECMTKTQLYIKSIANSAVSTET